MDHSSTRCTKPCCAIQQATFHTYGPPSLSFGLVQCTASWKLPSPCKWFPAMSRKACTHSTMAHMSNHASSAAEQLIHPPRQHMCGTWLPVRRALDQTWNPPFTYAASMPCWEMPSPCIDSLHMSHTACAHSTMAHQVLQHSLHTAWAACVQHPSVWCNQLSVVPLGPFLLEVLVFGSLSSGIYPVHAPMKQGFACGARYIVPAQD